MGKDARKASKKNQKPNSKGQNVGYKQGTRHLPSSGSEKESNSPPKKTRTVTENDMDEDFTETSASSSSISKSQPADLGSSGWDETTAPHDKPLVQSDDQPTSPPSKSSSSPHVTSSANKGKAPASAKPPVSPNSNVS